MYFPPLARWQWFPNRKARVLWYICWGNYQLNIPISFTIICHPYIHRLKKLPGWCCLGQNLVIWWSVVYTSLRWESLTVSLGCCLFPTPSPEGSLNESADLMKDPELASSPPCVCECERVCKVGTVCWRMSVNLCSSGWWCDNDGQCLRGGPFISCRELNRKWPATRFNAH